MNLCKIIGHKWDRFDKTFSSEIKLPGVPSGNFIEIRYNIKLCKRCMKKQKSHRNYGYPLGPSTIWIECDYTLEEKREMQLKKILT